MGLERERKRRGGREGEFARKIIPKIEAKMAARHRPASLPEIRHFREKGTNVDLFVCIGGNRVSVKKFSDRVARNKARTFMASIEFEDQCCRDSLVHLSNARRDVSSVNEIGV